VDARLEEVLGCDVDERVLEKVRATDIGLFAAGYVAFFTVLWLGIGGRGRGGCLDMCLAGGYAVTCFGRGGVDISGWVDGYWLWGQHKLVGAVVCVVWLVGCGGLA
jgi:hypothetical protein